MCFSLHLLTGAQYSLVPITKVNHGCFSVESVGPRCDDTALMECLPGIVRESLSVHMHGAKYGLSRDSIAWQLSLVCPQSP